MSAAPKKRKPAPPATLDVEFALIGVDCGHIARAIRAVGMAASRDEGRPILTTIRLTAKDRRLKLTATDSYRLHIADVEFADDAEFDVLAPAWWLVKTWPVRSMRSTQFLRVGVGGTSMTITTPDGISTTAPLIAGQYPNIDKLLDAFPDEPNDSLSGMAFNPEFLAESCKAARLFVGPNSPHPIRCTSVEPGRPIRLDVIGDHGSLQIVQMPVVIVLVAGRADDRMDDDIARKAAADEASLRMVAGVARVAAEIGVAGSSPDPATPKDEQP